MSALASDIGTMMEAHALARRWSEKHARPESRAEHRRVLALRVPCAATELDIMAAHLRALGVDVAPLYAAIDAARLALYEAAVPALSEVKADTAEQEKGRRDL